MKSESSVASEQGVGGSELRGRSSIEFTYNDIDDAIAVATAVHQVGGTSCDWDQLAAKMRQAPSGGGFRLKVMSARTFGLLEYDRGRVELTDLGLKVIDAKFARAARVESFLRVPLFRAGFEKFKNAPLPPLAAIERQFEQLGVAPKQKDKARQVFIRSAKAAGFFDLAPDRLVLPSTGASNSAPSETDDESRERREHAADSSFAPPSASTKERIVISVHGMDDWEIYVPIGLTNSQWRHGLKMAKFILDNYRPDEADGEKGKLA